MSKHPNDVSCFGFLDSPVSYHSLLQTSDFQNGYNIKFCLAIEWKDLFFIQNITKENCLGSVNSFHRTDFLHLYKFF